MQRRGPLLYISVKTSQVRRLLVSGAKVELKKRLIIIQQFSNLIGDSTANVCPGSYHQTYQLSSEHSNSWIQIDMERKRIRLASGYWWYVILVLIDQCDNLHGRLLHG